MNLTDLSLMMILELSFMGFLKFKDELSGRMV